MKKISTRGRKREARRWMQETKARLHKFPQWFGNPAVWAQTPPEERNIGRWSTAAALAYVRESEALRKRDPALYAAVEEVECAEERKFVALTREQQYAQFLRRVEKSQREKRRARRRADRQAESRVEKA